VYDVVESSRSLSHLLTRFLFYQFTALSSRAMDGPSNVFRRFCRRQSFNSWYRDLAHPFPNFHRGQKVQNLASFSTSLNFDRSRVKMQQDIWTLKQISCVEWSLYVLSTCGKVGSTHPWETFNSRAPPLKLHGVNVLNRWQLSGGFYNLAQIWYKVKDMTPKVLKKFKIKK